MKVLTPEQEAQARAALADPVIGRVLNISLRKTLAKHGLSYSHALRRFAEREGLWAPRMNVFEARAAEACAKPIYRRGSTTKWAVRQMAEDANLPWMRFFEYVRKHHPERIAPAGNLSEAA